MQEGDTETQQWSGLQVCFGSEQVTELDIVEV